MDQFPTCNRRQSPVGPPSGGPSSCDFDRLPLMKILATFSALMLAGSLAYAQAPAATASAVISDAMGKPIGTATLRETSSGVLIKVDFTAAPSGTHALHVHTTGK